MDAPAFRKAPPRWAKYLTLLIWNMSLSRLCKPWFKTAGNAVLYVSSKLVIKVTSTKLCTMGEAYAMMLACEKTSLPVPKVYCAFIHKEQIYIAMERLPGDKLAKGWADRSPESKQKIHHQLKAMVDELRSIEPPKGTGVASIGGGPLSDPRLPRMNGQGPFATFTDFHLALREGVKQRSKDNHLDVNELMDFQDSVEGPPVFTHGDLSSLNILVLGDTVTGIIDWETSGWYPNYWEYVTTKNVNPYNTFWQDEVDHFLTPYPYALEMDAIRLKYFGDY
jgi:aminoglycoside phosphotransferase